MSKVTFESLRAANASRAPRWHTSPAGMNEWTIGDWFMAMAGEVGEGADELLPLMFMSFVGKLGALGNMAKKYRRVQEGIANKANDPSRHINAENAIAKMFEELADVQIYLDLFALRLRDGLHTDEDIGDHVERKFNKTSELYGFPERIIDGQFVLMGEDGPQVIIGAAPKEIEVQFNERIEISPGDNIRFSFSSEGRLLALEVKEEIAPTLITTTQRERLPPDLKIHPLPDRLKTQKDEFDKLEQLSKFYDYLPPVVDDSYPEARRNYEHAMTEFIDAIRENGRLGPVTDDDVI